ncbi:MAG TPA: hypothetical protein PK542_06260 [Treponemataceae bacterium]|nr:hypothetical protein [Treponemataceae bacterium]HPS44072.1 hypothetical protein [Treponemataceae bacterium]
MNHLASSARVTALRALLVGIALCGAALFASCSSKLVVHFASLPGDVPVIAKNGFENHVPAPAEPAGGVVYIQTGLSADSAVFGPYPVEPGKDLVIKGFPAKKYDNLALFYAPKPLPSPEGDSSDGTPAKANGTPSRVQSIKVTGLPISAESPGAFWERTASSEVALGVFQDSGAVALFGKTTVHLFRKTVLGARLIPLSSTVFSALDGALPPSPDTAGKVRKQFIKIDGRNSKSLYVMLSNYQGKGVVYAGTVCLYGCDGSILDTKTFNHHIPEDLPESVLFKLPDACDSWLYVEYISAGDTKLPLFFY